MPTRTRIDRPVLAGRRHGVEHAGERLDAQRAARAQRLVLVEHELDEAADTVAAHLRLGAVGVEDAHPPVREIRGQDGDQPVRADPEVPVADALGEGRPRLIGARLALAGVVHDEVVAGPVHLPERQLVHPAIVRSPARRAQQRGGGLEPASRHMSAIIFATDLVQQ